MSRQSITVKTLKNGVKVLLAPRQHTHLATVLVGFRVGSNYEKDGQHGLAHFYEHMCFKGTKKYPTPIEFVRTIELLGGSTNAFTANDVTAYHITVPAKQIKRAIALVGEMILHPLFSGEELERERGVILSEMRLYKDDPWSVAQEELERLLFHNTPGALPVIGSEKDVRAVTREDFVRFYNEYYTGSQTVAVITGAFDPSDLSATDVFSIRDVGTKKKRKPVKPSPAPSKYSIVSKAVEQCVITIGFPGVGWNNVHHMTLDALADILGGGLASRLGDRVREKMGACYTIHAAHSNRYTAGYGYFTIGVGTELRQFDEVMHAIAEEIQKLKKDGVTEEEVKKYINSRQRKVFSARESVAGFAQSLFLQEVVKGSVLSERDTMRELKKVTPGRVLTAARKFLTTGTMRVSVVGPIKNRRAIEGVIQKIRV